MKIANRGFTLIELVMVIVILGILAVAAIPRFIDLETDARISAVNGMRAAITTGAMLARSKAIIDGVNVSLASTTADLDGDGTAEALVYGYPDSANADIMTWIVDDLGDFTYDNATGRYTLAPNCYVQYVNATSADDAPAITIETSGC